MLATRAERGHTRMQEIENPLLRCDEMERGVRIAGLGAHLLARPDAPARGDVNQQVHTGRIRHHKALRLFPVNKGAQRIAPTVHAKAWSTHARNATALTRCYGRSLLAISLHASIGVNRASDRVRRLAAKILEERERRSRGNSKLRWNMVLFERLGQRKNRKLGI